MQDLKTCEIRTLKYKNNSIINKTNFKTTKFKIKFMKSYIVDYFTF